MSSGFFGVHSVGPVGDFLDCLEGSIPNPPDILATGGCSEGRCWLQGSQVGGCGRFWGVAHLSNEKRATLVV